MGCHLKACKFKMGLPSCTSCILTKTTTVYRRGDVASPKFGRGQIVSLSASNSICFGTPPLEKTRYARLGIWGSMAPLAPPSYAYVQQAMCCSKLNAWWTSAEKHFKTSSSTNIANRRRSASERETISINPDTLTRAF